MRCDLKKTLTMQLSKNQVVGSTGDDRDRTGGLLLAKQALSQLSYVPGEGPIPMASQPGSLLLWAQEGSNL